MAINDPDSNAAQLMAAFNNMNQNIGKLNNTINTLMSKLNETKQKSNIPQSELRQQALQIKQESAYFSDVIEQNKILNATTRNLGTNVINNLRNITKNDKGQLNYLEKARQREDIRDIQNKTKTRKDGVFTRFLSQTMTEIDNQLKEIGRNLTRAIDKRTEEKIDFTSKGFNTRQINELREGFKNILDQYEGLDKSKIDLEKIGSNLSNAILGSGINLRDLTEDTKKALFELGAMNENVSTETVKTIVTLKNQGIDVLQDVVNRTKSLRELGYTGDVNEIFTGVDPKEIAKTAQIFGISAQEAMRLELERNTVKYMSRGIYGNDQVGNFIDSIAMASRGDYSQIGGDQNYTAALSLLGMDYKGMQSLLSSEGGYVKLQQMLTNKIKELQVNGDPRAASELARALGMDLEAFYQIRTNEKGVEIGKRASELKEEMKKGHDLQRYTSERVLTPEERIINFLEQTRIFQNASKWISDTGIVLDGSIASSIKAIGFSVLQLRGITPNIIKAGQKILNIGKTSEVVGDIGKTTETATKIGTLTNEGAKLANEGSKVGKIFQGISKAGKFLKSIPYMAKGIEAVSNIINGKLLSGISDLATMGVYAIPGVGQVFMIFDMLSGALNLFNIKVGDTSDAIEWLCTESKEIWELLKELGTFLWNKTTDTVKKIGNFIGEAWEDIKYNVDMFFHGALPNFLDNYIKPIYDEYIEPVLQKIGVIYDNYLAPVINPLIESLKEFSDWALKPIKTIGKTIGGVFDTVADKVVKVFTNLGKWFDENVGSVFRAMKEEYKEKGGLDLSVGGYWSKQVKEAKNYLKAENSHKDGLYNVPYNEYPAYLHKGEMVLTKEEATEYRNFINTLKYHEKGLNTDGSIREGTEEQKIALEMMKDQESGGAHYSATNMDNFVDEVRQEWGMSVKDYQESLNKKYNIMQEEKKASQKIRKVDGSAVGTVRGTPNFDVNSRYLIGEFENIVSVIAGASNIINKLKEDKLGIRLISAYRNDKKTKELVEKGVGVNNSLHRAGLAIDYNLVEGDGKFIEVGDKKGLSDEVKNKYNEYSTLIQGLNGNFYGGHNFTNSWDGNHIQLRKSAFLANRAKYVEEVLKKQRDLNEKATKTDEEVEILKEQLKCLQNIYTNNKEESDRNKPKPVITKPGPRAVLNHNNRTR